MELKGTIKEILKVESGVSKAGKEFYKQKFIIDTGDQYNPDVCFDLFGKEKTDNFSKYNKVGDEVTVSFNLSSRNYNDNWFHNVSAWKVENHSKGEEDDQLPY